MCWFNTHFFIGITDEPPVEVNKAEEAELDAFMNEFDDE